ncbi:MAG: sugar transferase [Candidatus Acidiferrum sp.]|jgi:lipopolysaccharide/colanic/teichoic acid biosynthesis glycosyltransferase
MSVLNPAIPQGNPSRKLEAKARVSVTHAEDAPARIALNEDAFVSMLYLERRRAERTEKRFVLVLVDASKALSGNQKSRTIQQIAARLSDTTRETDIIGWYVENSVIGIIGTELGDATPKVIQERFLEKLRLVIDNTVGEDKSSCSVSFHFFPEEKSEGNEDHSANIALYPELSRREERKKFSLAVKRAIDIIGSAAALVVFAPVFVLIAAAIKWTSKGPVLFCQERLGQYGKKFRVLKFRSMRTDCDSKIHEAYVNQFIAGQVDGNEASDSKKPVYKIQSDPRITEVGHFLRKTSLDEFPQFWNVLVGDMSLVGPRPPVAYEYRAYNVWHRRRVLEIKPGITGLWQVEGRSRTRFDDMVRLDLRYARGWSVWLDLKILAQTPSAVLKGDGAH